MPHTAWIARANAYLPLAPEEERIITEALVKVRMRLTDTPIFDSINTDQFWLAQFNDMSGIELRERAHILGVPVRARDSCTVLRTKLAVYWKQRIEDTSRGNY